MNIICHQLRKETSMNTSQKPLSLYGVALSGHVHRVMLLLDMLELPYTLIEAPAEVRASEDFRRLNPLGQIPVLVDGDVVIPDSNAIMVYLVKRYAPSSAWLPAEPVAVAHVQRWLSLSAGEIRFGPAAARIALQWGRAEDALPASKIAERVLHFMELHLSGRSFLATDYATLADLACYSYVAGAPEGGISLTPYPLVRAWLQRIEALPRFKGMPPLPVKVAA
jgi:glutathione S-transferase